MIGQVCVKVAGRDAGKKCVVVDVLDDIFVLIDGGTRRRKCNVSHLVLLKEKLDIKKGCSHDDVVSAFKKLGFDVWNTKPKKSAPRPKAVRKGKSKAEKEAQIVAKKELHKKMAEAKAKNVKVKSDERGLEHHVNPDEPKLKEREAVKEENADRQEKKVEEIKQVRTKKNQRF